MVLTKMDDKLNEMFLIQRKLQNKLGNLERIEKSEKLKQSYINQMILAIHEEAVEIMRETPYKNPEYVEFGWKKNQEWNEEKYKDEIIDLWHFVMNLSIAVNMDAKEFYERYLFKNNINIERKNNSY